MTRKKLPHIKQSGFYVYGLTDVRSGHIRYVGKVNGYPNSRLKSHIYEARYGKRHNHRLAWIRKLLKDGFPPRCIVLEKCSDDEELIAAEKRWIAHFRVMGAKLVNATDGGEGMANPSAETREKLSRARRGRKLNVRPEAIEAKREFMKNKWKDPEFRANVIAASEARRIHPKHVPLQGEALYKRRVEVAKMMGERNKGKSKTPEHRAKLAEATRKHLAEHGHPFSGKKLSPEHVGKLRGRKRTPEQIARIVAGTKRAREEGRGRWQSKGVAQ